MRTGLTSEMILVPRRHSFRGQLNMQRLFRTTQSPAFPSYLLVPPPVSSSHPTSSTRARAAMRPGARKNQGDSLLGHLLWLVPQPQCTGCRCWSPTAAAYLGRSCWWWQFGQPHFHGAHWTVCKEHNIELVCFPPNSTDKMQPLDVGCFSPLKVGWRKHLDNYQGEDPMASP